MAKKAASRTWTPERRAKFMASLAKRKAGKNAAQPQANGKATGTVTQVDSPLSKAVTQLTNGLAKQEIRAVAVADPKSSGHVEIKDFGYVQAEVTLEKLHQIADTMGRKLVVAFERKT